MDGFKKKALLSNAHVGISFENDCIDGEHHDLQCFIQLECTKNDLKLCQIIHLVTHT